MGARTNNCIHNLKNNRKESTEDFGSSSVFARLSWALTSSGRTFGTSLKKRAFVFSLAIIPIGSIGSVGSTLQNDDFVSSITPTGDVAISQNDTVLQLDESITFTFDAPQRATTADVYNMTSTKRYDVSVRTSWNTTNTQLTVTPEAVWLPGQDYTVVLSENIPDGALTPDTLYYFRTVGLPQVTHTIPANNSVDVVLGANSTVDFLLDRDASDFDFRAIVGGITIESQSWHILDDGTLRLELSESITQQGEIDITLYTKHIDQDDRAFTPIGQLSFKALASKPDTWAEDRDARLAEASASTPAQIKNGKYIDINLTARITTLFEDGEIVRQFINSPGAEATPTPTGEFEVHNKALKPESASFGVMLPYWMAFTQDGAYGLHGLVEYPVGHEDLPEGGKESSYSIDRSVSPGCVRHTDEDSLDIYTWTDIGTQVIIYQ